MYLFETTDEIFRSFSMKSVKINKKDLIESVKAKAKPTKTNYTFRLDITTYEAFAAECKKQGVKPTATVEEFLKVFIKK